MYIKWGALCLINVLCTHGLNFIGINDGYKHLLENIQPSAALHTKTRWIEQNLDHFDPTVKQTWYMRYFERLDLFKTDGPIYVLLDCNLNYPYELYDGLVSELAEETGGAMFMPEHRYFGKSQPLNVSNVEDMQYLSTSQVLADLEHLIVKIKEKPTFRNSKVVVIGRKYGGNLAAWMRFTYQELVDAGIASGAPVLAKTDVQEYLEVVTNNYEKYGTPGCVQKIKNIFERYDSLFQSEDGIKQLKEEENICEETDMSQPANKQLFFLEKTYLFVVHSQFHNHIEIVCSRLNEINTTFTQLDDEQYYWNKKKNCYDYNFDTLMKLFYEIKDLRHFYYQICTEFGHFITTTSDKQPFTKNMPTEFHERICTSLFGPEFNRDRVDAGVRRINKQYRGNSLYISKVVFVTGELDGYSPLAITEDLSPLTSAIVIPKVSSCRELDPEWKNDVEELKEARVQIKDLIKTWIGA